MTMEDPDVQLLAEIASSLKADFVPDVDAWRDSPFAWLKQPIASRTVGTVFERLVGKYFAVKGFRVSEAAGSDADRVIDGLRVEIKGSTLWRGGVFRFQQIRDQQYDIVICLGISPYDAWCWVIPKNILLAHPEGVVSQHGGQGGRDTAWLTVAPDNPPAWLHRWGGRLSDAYRVLRELTAGP